MGTRNYIILLLVPVLLRWNFKPQLAQTDGLKASLEASRLWKLEQNNMTKKGPVFGPQNVRKSRRAKMGLPSRSLDGCGAELSQ